jgi:aminoglycoside phosphotransferase
LRRLEGTTRYRPVHINALLLGAFSPLEERDFLYSPDGGFHGEAAQLLEAVGIHAAGKPADAVHTEFQRVGLFLTHVLECPLESGVLDQAEQTRLLTERLPAVASRIRRSLKPKSVILVTEPLKPVVHHILVLDLGCPVVLNNGKPFVFSASRNDSDFSQFRENLRGSAIG